MSENKSSACDSCRGEGDERSIETVYIVLGVVFLCLLLFGTAFTASLIYVYKKTRKLQIPTNCFIMGMIVADFLMLTFGIPPVVVSCFSGGHQLGTVSCQFESFMMTAIGLACICILTAISIDRYITIVHSNIAKKITCVKSVITTLVCFGYGVVWSVLPFLGFGSFGLEKSGVSCGPDWGSKRATDQAYAVSMFVFLLLVPLIIMTFCYVKIIVRVKTSLRQAGLTDEAFSSRDIEVTLSVVLTIVSFLFCWTPYTVVSFWSIINDVNDLSIVLAIFAPLMAKTSAVWNPLVYVIKNAEFRKAYKKHIISKVYRPNRIHHNAREGRGPLSMEGALNRAFTPVTATASAVTISEPAVK